MTVAIEITPVRLEAGNGHERINGVMWRFQARSVGQNSRQAIVDWLDNSNNNRAVVGPRSSVSR